MRITFIKLFNNKKKNNPEVLMKHLRDNQTGSYESNIVNNIKTRTKDLINKLENNKNNSYIKENKCKIDNKQSKNKNGIIKKNQVALTIVALMLVTAGYMNYTNNLKLEDVTDTADLGDAKLVSSNLTKEKDYIENNNVNNENNENSENNIEQHTEIESINEIINNATETYSNSIETSISNEYFSKTKLERDTMYSQMLESYQKILENNNIENEQKNVAANEIKNINNRKNAISTIENLLKTKNMNESVILINDNSINVIIKSKDKLNEEQIAQIYNIVSRELNANIEDVHITTHA